MVWIETTVSILIYFEEALNQGVLDESLKQGVLDGVTFRDTISVCDFLYKKRWVAKHHPANQPFLIKGVDVLSPPLVPLLYLSTKKSSEYLCSLFGNAGYELVFPLDGVALCYPIPFSGSL